VALVAVQLDEPFVADPKWCANLVQDDVPDPLAEAVRVGP
jgi:hypothetical protein